MTDIIKGTKITAQVIPGTNQTVSSYGWTLDGTAITNPGYVLDTANFSIGPHTVIFQATNSCGNSGNATLQINIIEGINMQQTDPININQPVMAVTVNLRRTSTVTVTVLDDPNGPNPNAPVVGATVSIGGKTGITDTSGKVTLSAVPYASPGTITTVFT